MGNVDFTSLPTTRAVSYLQDQYWARLGLVIDDLTSGAQAPLSLVRTAGGDIEGVLLSAAQYNALVAAPAHGSPAPSSIIIQSRSHAAPNLAQNLDVINGRLQGLVGKNAAPAKGIGADLPLVLEEGSRGGTYTMIGIARAEAIAQSSAQENLLGSYTFPQGAVEAYLMSNAQYQQLLSIQ